MESILTSIKEQLGITKEYKQFDNQIIMHINSVFMILKQLGVGPSEGFFIKDDSAKWTEFIPNPYRLQAVKSYVYLKVRMLFDNVSLTSAVISANNELIKELEWRLLVEASESESSGEEENQNGEY